MDGLAIERVWGPPGPDRSVRKEAADAAEAAVVAYFDGLDHGVVLVDRRGGVALCSAQARGLLGLPEARDAPDRSLRRSLGPGWRKRHRLTAAHCGELLRRGGAFEVAADDSRADDSRAGAVTGVVRRMPGGGWSLRVARSGPGRPSDDAEGAATDLPDRADLRRALADAGQCPDASFAVLAVSLDRFRQVNDTLGHAVGDALLRMVARRLRTTLRRDDFLARLPGDAFAILQDGVQQADDAGALARRIVELLGRAFMVDGHLVNIDASVGVALAPAHGLDPDALLERADLALGRAKRDGGATARLFEAAMDASSRARRALELDLRRAAALGQFELAYQPQVDLGTGRVVGCEALIRWRHPARGVVSPAEFIPLAEEIGLISRIGDWVLRTACREAVGWPASVTVAVNLSPAQFRTAGLVDGVASALAASGLAPHRLELEVTEGLLLRETEANLGTLDALRRLGARIAIDDFGTGYASLSALRAFPFDRIKIDRSFVSGEKAGHKSSAIVRAIAELAATFGMTTVAEGVETADQLRSVRAEGCTTAQGYLIGRPVPAADIAFMLAAGHHDASRAGARTEGSEEPVELRP